MNDYNTKWIFEGLGIEPNKDFHTDINSVLTCKMDENLNVFIKDDEGNYNCFNNPYILIGILKGDVKILKNKNIIKYIPTADVQKVKHGEWVYHYRLKKFVCLECGYETKHKSDFNYCPNCGAKMDKEREK